jgi:hypothetical protein
MLKNKVKIEWEKKLLKILPPNNNLFETCIMKL